MTEAPTVYAVMLQRASLQKLIDIPESSRNSVRTIDICTRRLSREIYDHFIQYILSPAPEDSDEDVDGTLHPLSGVHEDDIGYIESLHEAYNAEREYGDIYLGLLEEQERFMEPGLATAYLIRAMNGLPNCHTIRLSDEHDPLGADQLENDVEDYHLRRGFDANSQESQDYVKYVLKTTLTAISTCCIQVTSFEIRLLPIEGQRNTGPITSHVLALTANYQQLFYQSFESITSLRLVLSPGHQHYWDCDVSSFLCIFPKLSHFRLQLADSSNNVPFTQIAERKPFKKLQTFELAHGSTTEAHLVELLHSFRAKLEKIVLRNVNIETNRGWLSIVARIGAKLPAKSFVLQDCRYLGYPLASSTNKIPQSFEIVTKGDAKRVAELLQNATPAMINST